MDQYSRTRLLLGDEAMQKLKSSRVAVFGLGGVGGYVVEALARSGVGALDLIDHDTISETNLNRQIFALRSTIGMDSVKPVGSAGMQTRSTSGYSRITASAATPQSIFRSSTAMRSADTCRSRGQSA